jgi:hypothetical protein
MYGKACASSYLLLMKVLGASGKVPAVGMLRHLPRNGGI